MLASSAHLGVGDTISLSARPGENGERVIVAAIVRRGADPSEVSRGDMRVRLKSNFQRAEREPLVRSRALNVVRTSLMNN